MLRSTTVVKQHLTAAFFIVIGLIAYGCGDSAKLNPVVELASLAVKPGTLTPAFSGGTTQYNVDLSNSVTSVTVSAQAAVKGDTVTINGQATTSSVITLDEPGKTTPVNIVVSESNTNSRTYTLLLVRALPAGNNSLAGLTVSSGALNPAFDANTLNYTVNVIHTVGNISLTPTLSDPSATMTVNGQSAANAQAQTISLNGAGSNTMINILVTAQNGSQKPYSVNVIREAPGGNNNLSSLTVQVGTEAQALSPTFSSATTDYTVNVGSNVASITMTATLEDTTATMTINGQGTPSGQARDITLGPEGSSTNVSIVVIAPNGVQKTHTMTVIRALPEAPKTPASAPDLIPQDDSCLRNLATNECLPGTSTEDNITNVPTPRFQISPPKTGETPSLYVDGDKVAATFDPAANTLKPTEALSDEVHQITYTVANAGGESPQSPVLTVTIDSGSPGAPTQ